MLPLAFLSFLSLVLQFDGSHRPPKDFGFPTDSMRKLPSCSSAILVDSDEKVLALGGKLIPVNIGMTSADAEYDGLLVGLEWLGKQDEDWWTQHTATSKTLTIRGDNKAIIDQLRGSALPRKLNEKHQNGQQILETIQKHFTTFNYEHVLRNQNVLCDAVCGEIIQLSVSRILNTFQTDVKACTNASPDGETDKRKRKATTSPLATIIQSYLNEASAIPHSIRPAILKQLIHKAESLSDGYALVAIGELLEAESKLWADCGARVVPGSHDCRELLLVQGLQLQMKGWTLRRNEKEAGKISRKHKFNLNQYGNMVTPTPVGVWPTMLQESSKVPAYVVWSERAEKMILHGPSDEQHNAIWVEKLL